jgi:hypothetical protein
MILWLPALRGAVWSTACPGTAVSTASGLRAEAGQHWRGTPGTVHAQARSRQCSDDSQPLRLRIVRTIRGQRRPSTRKAGAGHRPSPSICRQCNDPGGLSIPEATHVLALQGPEAAAGAAPPVPYRSMTSPVSGRSVAHRTHTDSEDGSPARDPGHDNRQHGPCVHAVGASHTNTPSHPDCSARTTEGAIGIRFLRLTLADGPVAT